MQLPRNSKGQLESYAWPGGYPLGYLDGHDSILCADCARKSDTPDEIEGFKPAAFFIVEGHDESEPETYCDNCSKAIH